jgi:pimeloyl-ACP methyl ester carboxylesterase
MSKKPLTAAHVATGVGVILGGAALAATAIYTEIMTSVVARRRAPFTDALIAAATKSSDAPIDPEIREKAQALLHTPMTQVAIRSKDRYVLRARWYPAEGAKRTVILAHGWHSCWNLDFSASAPFLHEQGCNLLFIDQRCHGESGGDLISYGIKESRDILSWLKWLDRHHSGLPVYLCGVSMGAATVLMATGGEIGNAISGRVAGVIADCGYSSAQEIIKITLKKSIGGMASPTLAAINLNCKLRENFTFGKYSPLQAMTENQTIPCLFVHGTEDDFVPWRMTMENYYACRAPKDLLLVNGAGHGVSFLVAPEVYRQKILDFFTVYDKTVTATPAEEAPTKKARFRKKKSS